MANDQDVIEIKDKVESVKNDINEIKSDVDSVVSSNGVKIKDGVRVTFNGIQKLEQNLSETNSNTHLTSQALTNGGGLFNLINDIRNAVTGLRSNISSAPSNNSTGSGSNNVTITNAASQSDTFGGFSDSLKKIYEEIRTFHADVLSQEFKLSPEDVEKLGPKGLEGYFKSIQDAKDKIQKQKEEEEHKKKTDPEYYKKEKQRKKEEERAQKRAEHKGAKNAAGLAKDAAVSLLSGTDTNGLVNGITGALSKMPGGAVAGGIIQIIKAAFDAYAKVDKEAAEYARTVGGSKYQKNNIFNTSQRIAGNTRALYGINQEEIIKQAKEVAEAFGRNISHISDKAMESSLMLKKMGIDAQTLGNLDTYGLSIEQADQHFSDLYKRVSKHGISFKNVSKAVSDNLKAAQSYSFANGLRGLEQMAERSTQLKFNVQQAMTFAEKVSTFEGAIQAGANLSVLGGSFAAYSNPMQMMYEALNDVEALQERMIKTYSGKAFWDSEKGQMRIAPEDLRLIRAAAEAMGVDKSEMINMTMNQAKFSRIDSQINKNLFDDDTIEFIKNLSELDKNGNASITLNGKTKAVSGLTAEDSKFINKEMEQMEQKKNATVGDIYVNTMGIGEKLDNLVKYITTKLGTWVAKIAGVKYEDKASKAVWHALSHEEKMELIGKHGSRNAAKRAVGMGQEAEVLESYLAPEDKAWNSDDTRDYLNEYARRHRGRKKFRNHEFDDDITNFTNRKKFEQKEGGIISGNYHVNGGTPAIYNGMPVEIEKDETLFGKDVLYRYGSNFLRNIADYNVPTISNIQGNNMNPIVVAPTFSPQGGGGKVSFDTIKIELGGKLELTSGNKRRELDLSNLSAADMDRLAQAISKPVYTEIARRFEKGYNKETNPFREM